MSNTSPPSWPHCGHGADQASDPVGCRGRQVPGHTTCLAHLTDAELAAYLTGLAPGSDIDHRDTLFTEQLLQALLNALTDPATSAPRLGNAVFRGAQFSGDTGFDGAQFSSKAWFAGAQFSDGAGFLRAQFSDGASFAGAQFSGNAWFAGVQLSGDVQFDGAQFSDSARFDRAQFSGDAWFNRAQFSRGAGFLRAQFSHGAGFEGAQFSGDTWFDDAQFSGHARFDDAQFSGNAWFLRGQFSDGAQFDGAQFSGDARFDEVQFSGHAWFSKAQFSRSAGFDRAQFSRDALFDEAQFSGDAWFDEAQFSGNTWFGGAQFVTAAQLGPLVCQRTVSLSGARFGTPVSVEVAAARVVCKGTRWDAKGTLRLRYAALDLTDAVIEYPLSVTSRTTRFTWGSGEVPEGGLAGNGPSATASPSVRVVSLSGADAAHLALHNVDLAECLFFGTIHLDQLRLEGQCPLIPAATGWWWTRRGTLAEEHHWRASRNQRGWTAPPPEAEVRAPAALATAYRQLRKSFEDGKNEPDAADFYYGEMTMRRLDRSRPLAERTLLAVYWAISGYGLRALRALGWLLGAMVATILVMMLWGLPAADPKPNTTGQLTGQDIALTTDTPAPENPAGPLTSRLTSQRWEKSLRIVVNSVVFRSSGQDLTTTGT